MGIYAKVPVFRPEGAVVEFRSLMEQPPESGILRAVTLRVNPKPSAEWMRLLMGLALKHGFSLRAGEETYYTEQGFEFTVVTFFNEQSPA